MGRRSADRSKSSLNAAEPWSLTSQVDPDQDSVGRLPVEPDRSTTGSSWVYQGPGHSDRLPPASWTEDLRTQLVLVFLPHDVVHLRFVGVEDGFSEVDARRVPVVAVDGVGAAG